MYKKLEDFKLGYNSLTDIEGEYSNMLQDIGIYYLSSNSSESFLETNKETAILLLEGKVTIEWDNNSQQLNRESVFEENPWCLHVPKDVKVKITAIKDSEVLVQKTINNKIFSSKLYSPNDCQSEVVGDKVWNNTALRTIRTIFDYDIAPYSNMVMGEVISHPGNWSSFPPHSHDQPEVYYYRFNKPQGFGCVMVGQDAFRVEHNSFITIPGGLDHPQATAPGYAMYFCWMIRHLENNPWTERVMNEEHKWLLKDNVKIWPDE